MSDKMRVVEISQPGGPEVLRLAERDRPVPGPDEVLIRVDAAGVNRPDVLQRMGLYPPTAGASDLPGLEVAGSIAAIGAGVTGWTRGELVCALIPGGGYAEYAIAHIGACLPLPSGISIEEAAAIPETFFTVWANVYDDAGLRAGETLLVHGGTSGIGVTSILLARAFGSKVIATASSDAKCDAIRKLGADLALRYDGDDWEERVRDFGGADVVLDMAGGDFVERNLNVLNDGGRHVSIAFQRGMNASMNVMMVMRKRLRLSGSTMKARGPEEKARLAQALEKNVWPLISSGAARPIIDRIYPLEAASDAHAYMEAGGHTGKIVLSTH